MKLSKAQYEQLLNFVGYGDLENARIIFFGNEEGAGMSQMEANIIARCEYFGRKNNNKIYWQKNAKEADEIIYKLTNASKKKKIRSEFLKMMARIACGINDINNLEQWIRCKPVEKSKNYYENTLFEYLKNELLSGNEKGIKLALVDWAPLPRPNQSSWPDEYSDIDRKMYESEFYFKSVNTINKDGFTNYRQDVEKRKEVIQETLKKFKGNIIIGFGQVDVKQGLLKNIFSDIVFSDMNLNKKSKYGITQIYGKKIHVFLLPFPCAGYVFKNGEDRSDFFSEFSTKYLKLALKK